MQKEVCVRFVRRIFMAVLVLLLLLLFNVQVMAEESAATAAMPENTDSYTAVAAQLEAVARAEGRSAADKMLYASFLEASVLHEASAAEFAAVDLTGAAVENTTESGSLLANGLWTVPAAAALVVFGLLAVAGIYRRGTAGRRTVYKPMRRSGVRPAPYLRYTVQHTYR